MRVTHSHAVPSVSVILCAYSERRWQSLGQAVESVLGQTAPASEIILVIDHNSALALRARAAFPSLTIVPNADARGLAGARNTGTRCASGDVVAFLDDDAVAEPGWLQELISGYADPCVLGVGGAILPAWEGEKPRWFPDEFLWVVGCSYEGLPRDTAPIRNMIGANMSFRRALFAQVGGFREGFGRTGANALGCEETDFCIRVSAHRPQGLFLYEPRARVRHAVPPGRASWRYYLQRCAAEGRSKALVTASAGRKSGLSTEWDYVLNTLPRAVIRGVGASVANRDIWPATRAAATVAGFTATTAAYALAIARARTGHRANVAPTGEDRLASWVDGRRLRVLQVTPRFFPNMGGIETHVYEVTRRLALLDVAVTTLTADTSGELPRAEVQDGVRIRRARAWPRGHDYYFAPAMYRAITRGGWDIVHVQGAHTLVAPLAMLAAWRAGIPYVVTFHTGGHSSGLRRAIRGTQWRLLRPLFARAAHLVGVSRFEAESFQRLLGLPASRFTVVPNGTTPLPAAPVSASAGERPLVLSLGRLERYKGHHRVIEAWPEVRRALPTARLLVLGAGPYEGELYRLIARLGLGDVVEIKAVPPRERATMARLLGSADLVTLMSDYEAHPVAVMEALALRRPVLVADTSGLRELAEQGLVTAIPATSSSATLASAIVTAIRQPAAPPEVTLPTWDGTAQALLELYRQVMRDAR